MVYKQYISMVGVTTGAATLALLWAIATIDPYFAEPIVFWVLALCFFIFSLGATQLIILTFMKRRIIEKMPVFKVVGKSLKYSTVVATGLTTALVLQARQWLNIGTFLVLLTLIILILWVISLDAKHTSKH